MVETRSQAGNITVKKEEEEDCKPALGLINVHNTRSSGRIAKRQPHIISNRRLPAQQAKVEEDTDNKPLLESTPKSSKLPIGQRISQKQICRLIHYIVKDNMSISSAAHKAKMSVYGGQSYYNIYRNDPEKKIPVPRNRLLHPRKNHTHEQVKNLIKYVHNDKMTMKEASAKSNMPRSSGHYYYAKYLKDPVHTIPTPQFQQNYTQDQREAFIGYIINDKMSIKAASKKAKMNISGARNYYRKYFKVENPDIARPSHIVTPTCYTQEQIKEVINYIVDGKMSIRAASIKANINPTTAGKYYQQYIKDNDMVVA